MRSIVKIMLTVLLVLAAENRLCGDGNTNPVEKSTETNLQSDELDQQRYIDVDQIKDGMRGYGLTVFHGTKIERFDVVVVSVVRNMTPKQDIILIRCEDDRFTLAKGVRGISGSPVYFDGKLAGAMSLGWTFGEEPLYGVTPIRQMLQVKRSAGPGGMQKNPKPVCLDQKLYSNLMRDVLLDSRQIEWLAQEAHLAETTSDYTRQTGTGLVTLSPAISVGGFNEQTLQKLREQIPGLVFMAGLSGGQQKSPDHEVVLTPGATLTIPLITGDMTGAVLGTVTEVIGREVYGFGHGWNGEGAASWPMGTGYIHTIVNSKEMSFKLGQVIDIVGAIQADETTAVYGQTGRTVPLVDVRIEVEWPDGTVEDYDVQIAQDRLMDPMLASMVATNAMMQRGDLPREHTIKYQIKMDFDGVETISYENVSSQNSVGDIVADMLSSLSLLLDNPWQEVKLARLEMQATIIDKFNVCRVKSAQLSKRLFQPTDTVEATVMLEPLYGKPIKVAISMPLPEDIPDGTYRLNIGSHEDYRRELQKAQPHRYTAFDIDDVQRVLQKRLSIRRDGLYMSIAIPEAGVAIEGRELPRLPGSKAMMLTDDLRKTIVTKFKSLVTAEIKTDYVVMGSESFEIEVRKE